MMTDKELSVRFEQIKNQNYRESMRLEGITGSGQKIKSKKVAAKVRELRAQYA